MTTVGEAREALAQAQRNREAAKKAEDRAMESYRQALLAESQERLACLGVAIGKSKLRLMVWNGKEFVAEPDPYYIIDVRLRNGIWDLIYAPQRKDGKPSRVPWKHQTERRFYWTLWSQEGESHTVGKIDGDLT